MGRSGDRMRSMSMTYVLVALSSSLLCVCYFGGLALMNARQELADQTGVTASLLRDVEQASVQAGVQSSAMVRLVEDKLATEKHLRNLQTSLAEAQTQVEKLRSAAVSLVVQAGALDHVTEQDVNQRMNQLALVAAEDCHVMVQRSFRDDVARAYIVVEPQPLPAWVQNSKEVVDAAPPEDAQARKQSFNEIFSGAKWNKDPNNPSGTGSALGLATDNALATLGSIIDYIKTVDKVEKVRMLDIPCGDMVWMQTLLKRRSNDIDYTGGDIVDALINQHKEKLANLTNAKFMHMDIVQAPPPGVSIDLVFTRHMMQHLTHEEARQALRNIVATRAKYLLATTYPDFQATVDLNLKVETRARKLNLQYPPFNLPPPLCWHFDFSYSFLALWKIETIKGALNL